MKLFDDSLPFYRGNFHTHTTCSDGRKSPAEAMAAYRARGYDFLALSDHRRLTWPLEDVPNGLLMLPAIELDYTLPCEVVHIVGVGVTQAVAAGYDNKQPPQHGIDLIRKAGGRAILCHPAWSLNSTATMASLHGLCGAEVYNSVSTAPYNALRADSSALLDAAAAHGTLLPLLANDDTHFYGSELAAAWNMVQAESLTQEGVLAALDAGRFYATQGPEIHQIEVTADTIRVTCSPAAVITFPSNAVWQDGRTFVGDGLTEAVYELGRGNDRWVRVQVVDAQGRSAWSSPIVLG